MTASSVLRLIVITISVAFPASGVAEDVVARSGRFSDRAHGPICNVDIDPGLEVGAWRRKATAVHEFVKSRDVIMQREAQGSEFGKRVEGVLRIPVFLVAFDDGTSPAVPRNDLEREIFDDLTGSVPRFFDEVSYSNLEVKFDVYGWRTLPQTSTHYTGGSAGLTGTERRREFIEDVITAFDNNVDFSLYDSDGPDGIPNTFDDDGFVDTILVVQQYEGSENYGFNSLGGAEADSLFWSHNSSVSTRLRRGLPTKDASRAGAGKVRVFDYSVSPGRARNLNQPLPSDRTVAHEIGHALGLPDLYDRETNGPKTCLKDDSSGIGGYGLMGSTSQWVHLSAYSKWRLGWISLSNVVSPLADFPLESATTTPTALRLFRAGLDSPEFFIVELRSQVGFDAALPTNGVLIYHVDTTQESNRNECQPLVDVECANQTDPDHTIDHDELALSRPFRSLRHFYTVSGERVFNGGTTPSTIGYGGTSIPVSFAIRDSVSPTRVLISADVGVDPADVDVFARDCEGDVSSVPSPCASPWISPDIVVDNDQDGTQDPIAVGENRLEVRVRNAGVEDAIGVRVRLYRGDLDFGLDPTLYGELVGSNVIGVVPSGGGAVRVPFLVTVGDDGLGGARQESFYAVVDDPDADPFVVSAGGPAYALPRLENAIVARRVGDFARGAGATTPARTAGAGIGRLFDESRVLSFEGQAKGNRRYRRVWGSPPNYDDVVIPDGWQVDVSPATWVASEGDIQDIVVSVSTVTAEHDQFVQLPITIIDDTDGSVVSGAYVSWRLDFVAPSAPRLGAIDVAPLPTSDTSGQANVARRSELEQFPVRLSWAHDATDTEGQAESVAHWTIEVVPDSMVSSEGRQTIRVAMDRDPGSPSRMDAVAPLPDVPEGAIYLIRAVDAAGNASEPLALGVDDQTTDVESLSGESVRLIVGPSPFDGTTLIQWNAAGASAGAVRIYDARGRLVRSIGVGASGGGWQQSEWDGTDRFGELVANGVYFVRYEGAHVEEVRRIVLLR